MRSMGFWVAEMPMRTGSTGHSAASRSSDSARCAPRLVSATACSSSTITVRTVASISRPETDVSRMNSDSGVVTRMCGGVRRMRARSTWRRVAGAHRRADLHVARTPRAAPGCRPAARPGSSGCRWTAPSAATRRARGFRRAARPGPRPPAPARRWRRGRRPASCPSPWARPAGCAAGLDGRPGPAWTGVTAGKALGTSRRRRDGRRSGASFTIRAAVGPVRRRPACAGKPTQTAQTSAADLL